MSDAATEEELILITDVSRVNVGMLLAEANCSQCGRGWCRYMVLGREISQHCNGCCPCEDDCLCEPGNCTWFRLTACEPSDHGWCLAGVVDARALFEVRQKGVNDSEETIEGRLMYGEPSRRVDTKGETLIK